MGGVKISLVILTVIITVATSLILDYAAHIGLNMNLEILFLLSIVIVINLLKFILWGWIHARFHLSSSYPLTAIFFPIIYLIAIFKNQSEFNLFKLSGVILILLGIFIIEMKQLKE